MGKKEYETVGHIAQSRKKGVAPIATIFELTDGYWGIDVPKGKVEANAEKIVSQHNRLVLDRDEEVQKYRRDVDGLEYTVEQQRRKIEELEAQVKHNQADAADMLAAKDAQVSDLASQVDGLQATLDILKANGFKIEETIDAARIRKLTAEANLAEQKAMEAALRNGEAI